MVQAITSLKKAARDNDAPIWKSIAKRLEGPSRNWPTVNISKLEYNSQKNSKIVVYAGLIAYWGVILVGTFLQII